MPRAVKTTVRKQKLHPLSLSALADILGCDRKTIREHEAGGNAPKRNDIEGWEVFMASMGRSISKGGNGEPNVLQKLAAARLSIARETAKKLKRENKTRAGELIDVAEARRQAVGAESFYFGEIERMQRELPAMLAGLDATGVRDQLEKFLFNLRERSREKFGAVAKT